MNLGEIKQIKLLEINKLIFKQRLGTKIKYNAKKKKKNLRSISGFKVKLKKNKNKCGYQGQK